MTLFTRKRVIALLLIAAFVAVFAAVGALSRSTPTAAQPVPSSTWFWTMAVSPSDPNTLVVGTANGLYRSSDGGRTFQVRQPCRSVLH